MLAKEVVVTSTPDAFSGEMDSCTGFRLQLSLFLFYPHSPQSFTGDAFWILYIIGLLQNEALKWAEAKYHLNTIIQTSFATFISDFKPTFNSTLNETEAKRRLWSLRKGQKLVGEYARVSKLGCYFYCS